MNRLRVLSPHSGGVLSLLRVDAGPFWRMPSPVPTSWSRKSEKGWMTFSPRASGTVKAPPSTWVPGLAVVMEGTWQVAQPTDANSAAPAWAPGDAIEGSGAGAWSPA